MTKNPILNAFAAILYIFIIASVMYYGSEYAAKPDDSVMAPIVIVSLFTLSAAVMGYIFLSQPLQLYLDGKKKAAVDLFLKTLVSFGGITFLIIILFFSGILP